MNYIYAFAAGFVTGALIYRYYYGKVTKVLRAERDKLREEIRKRL